MFASAQRTRMSSARGSCTIAGSVSAMLVAASTAACGTADHGPLTFDFDGGFGSSPPSDSGSVDAKKALPPADTGSTVDCPASAKLIYVTGEGSILYSFNPENGTFTSIGGLNCLTTPTHMTVDRQGTAWVVSEGQLYTANTTTAACSKVSLWAPDAVNYADFAVTFLGTTTATDSSLYILGEGGALGKFDTLTGHRTAVGTITLHPFGDMTTNGDGTLYFLVQAAVQTLNQIDPTDASVLASWTTGEDSENTQALAFYGGLFYDFIGTSVYTYDTATKTVVSLGTAPLYVTGAGQSTCVPTKAPPPPPLR